VLTCILSKGKKLRRRVSRKSRHESNFNAVGNVVKNFLHQKGVVGVVVEVELVVDFLERIMLHCTEKRQKFLSPT